MARCTLLIESMRLHGLTIAQCAAEAGVSVRSLNRYRNGEKYALNPGVEEVKCLAQRLGLDAGELRAAIIATAQANLQGEDEEEEEVNRDGYVRRQLLLSGIATATGVAIAPLSLTPTALPSLVDRSDIEQLNLAASQLAEMGNLAGGSGLVQVMGHAQIVWAKALLGANCPAPLRGELFCSVAALASEVAFEAFDSGNCEAAATLYRFATEVSEHSGNWSIRAMAYADSARVSTWAGNHDHALTCAEQGLVRLDRLSPIERAMAHTVHGRALAAMGRISEAQRAVGLADEAFSGRGKGDEEPRWMAFYDEAQHQGDTGHALYDVAMRMGGGGDSDSAAIRLQAAVDGHGSAYVRSRAFSRGKLAALKLRCGDIDEGLAIADVAVGELGSVQSHRARVYVREIATVAAGPRFAGKAAPLLERVGSG